MRGQIHVRGGFFIVIMVVVSQRDLGIVFVFERRVPRRCVQVVGLNSEIELGFTNIGSVLDGRIKSTFFGTLRL